MNRLGLLYPSELDDDGKSLYDELYAYTTAKYGTGKGIYITKDGRFVGPFGAHLHIPIVGKQFLGMAKAVSQLVGLSPKHREIAVLVTGARFKAAYELYGHRLLALDRGIAEEEFNAILHGECPATFTSDEKAVYVLADDLVNQPGPLSQEKWDAVANPIGKDTAVGLVQVVAFYSYVSTILNGFDCKVPNADD
ncbi:hypothetical protein PISL3812_06243 [Talaromyces islandicus]|uniref:Carboxymuconolactone decarboxylase-like domain-containing protein n=1 Tax=Talaromyces islandicus TaxID=28573 RepID=A0A0U1M0Z6_TALIS|nr:hypothetical protein PISL3812_06243 [Talaromyces islandicus]